MRKRTLKKSLVGLGLIAMTFTNSANAYASETATGSALTIGDFPTIEIDKTTEMKTASGSALAFNEKEYIDMEPIIKVCSVTGTVEPVTMMDITISLNGPSFRINENREFEGNTTTIISNSNFPIDVYLACISGITGNEPVIVTDETFTEREWNNLSENDSMSYIALRINGENLESIYNNFEMDKSRMIKVGRLKSAYKKPQRIRLEPSASHGKKFSNEDEITLQYDLILEFRIP